MKTCLWFNFLSLIAVAYGATIAPPVHLQKPVLSKENEAGVLPKAGKGLQNVGRLLQGDAVLTKEEQEEVLQVLTALTSGEGALSAEDVEYIWPLIIRGVITGAASFGVQKLLQKLG